MAESEIPRISSSGLLQIDTALIRERIPDLVRTRSQLDDVRGKIANCATQLSSSRFSTDRLHRMLSLGEQADVIMSETTHSLEQLAIAYEMLEIKNRIELLMQAGNYQQAVQLSKQLISLRAENPDAAALNVTVPDHPVTYDPSSFGQMSMTILALFALWASTNNGVITLGAKASGDLPKMRAVLVRSETITGANNIAKVMPRNLEGVARSVPDGKDSQIRVTRVTNTDGSEVFVVDVAGTQTNFGNGSFSLIDNIPLYQGERTKTFASVYAALEAAGAAPGDSIHLVGHSQGGMVSSWVAASGEYNTLSVTSFGAPVSAELPASVDVVEFAHSDDLVTKLAGAGHTHTLGSEHSFRYRFSTADDQGYSLDAHHMSSYIDAAAEADQSNDPRIQNYHRQRREIFADAAKIHITEYSSKELK